MKCGCGCKTFNVRGRHLTCKSCDSIITELSSEQLKDLRRNNAASTNTDTTTEGDQDSR